MRFEGRYHARIDNTGLRSNGLLKIKIHLLSVGYYHRSCWLERPQSSPSKKIQALAIPLGYSYQNEIKP